MTTCRRWRSRLLDAALEAGHPAALDSHLRTCSACAAALAELRSRREQLDAALAQLVCATPAPDFRARVLAGGARVSTPAVPGWTGAVAGALAVVLAALLLPAQAERRAALAAPRPAPISALSTWRSPTENLLRSPAERLLRQTPRLGEFYFSLDTLTPPPSANSGGNDNDEG